MNSFPSIRWDVWHTVSGGFSPDQIANLVFWFKTDTGVTITGSGISTWADQSGNGNNATQGVDGNRPTNPANQLNGYPAVRFDGVADFLDLPDALYQSLNPTATDFTYFLVMDPTGPDGNIRFFIGYRGSLPTQGRFAFQRTGSNIRSTIYDGVTKSASGDITDAAHYLVTTWGVGDAVPVLRIDGVLQVGANNGNAASNLDIMIGQRQDGTYFYDGDMFEFFCYSRKLSDSEIQSLETYLSNKYAI